MLVSLPVSDVQGATGAVSPTSARGLVSTSFAHPYNCEHSITIPNTRETLRASQNRRARRFPLRSLAHPPQLATLPCEVDGII